MSFNITLNSNNVVGNFNNTFQYNFVQGSFNVPENAEINVNQVTIPYSWFNISSQIGNNQITYYIPNSSNIQTAYNLTIPNGFYQISDLNTYLQLQMKANGHYWYSFNNSFNFSGTISTTTLTISSTNNPSITLPIGTIITGYGVTNNTIITAQTGPYTYTINNSQTVSSQTPMIGSQSNELYPNIIYPLSIQSYSTQYTNSITAITIPTAANIQNIFGQNYYYANGSDGQLTWTGGYPTTSNQCAYITFPTTNSTTQTIGNFLGFISNGLNVSNYPSTYSSLSVLSQTIIGNSLNAAPSFPPLGSTVNGIIIHCNLVDNRITSPPDILDSFPITSIFGSNINYLPISNNCVKMKPGRHNSIVITFTDQNNNPLYCNDPNVLIGLIINFVK
jgi:hypothetical protein